MKQLSIFYILIFLLSCNSIANKEDKNVVKRQYLRESNLVDILVLQSSDFQKEMVSNGHLKARKKSVLKCKVSEDLIKINFRNGDFVKKDAVIAELDSYNQRSQVREDKNSPEKSRTGTGGFTGSWQFFPS